jgi:ADP-ribosylglycohydrolase
MEAKDSAQAETKAAKMAERPLPNTYWIEPGRLLAGEYPGAMLAQATEERLRRFLDAGINFFIDLTRPGELPEYERVLATLEPTADYRRFGIIDHGLPANANVIVDVLDCVDQALAAGRNVYLHCRAGVGRTGTALGCYFIRRGLPSEAALDRLASAWQQSERSQFIPQIPETDAQAGYVRAWRESGRAASGRTRVTTSSRIEGALLGLAVGEAAAIGGRGVWASDTAMTLLLADSLLASTGVNLEDQLRRYQWWQQAGQLPDATLKIPVPAAVRRSIAAWAWSRKAYAGSHDPANLDAHSLARTSAVALYFRTRPGDAIEAAAEASRTTNQAPIVLDACRYFAALLLEAMGGTAKTQIMKLASDRVGPVLRARTLKPEVQSLLDRSWLETAPPAATGTAIGALSLAIWAFARSRDYREGLALMLASSSDAAIAASLYGALAGAHYAAQGLPPDLCNALIDQSLLEKRIAALVAHAPGQAG